MHHQWCTRMCIDDESHTVERLYEKIYYYSFSYLSSQKVHGVCNGMPDPSRFSIVLTVSSDNTVAFNKSDDVFSFASHSAAAMFETTMQAALQRQKSYDRHRRRRHHWLPLKTTDVVDAVEKRNIVFYCTHQQMSRIVQFTNCVR